MKKRVKIIAGAVLLGVLAVAGLVVLLMPVRVETETVQKADLLDTFTVSATVTPKDSQYVCAPLSGTVSEVAAKEGETVEQGAKIVVLDDSQTRDELNRQIESLKAQKTSAQSEGTSTKAQLSVSRQQLESQLNRHSLPINSFTGRRGMRSSFTGWLLRILTRQMWHTGKHLMSMTVPRIQPSSPC